MIIDALQWMWWGSEPVAVRSRTHPLSLGGGGTCCKGIPPSASSPPLPSTSVLPSPPLASPSSCTSRQLVIRLERILWEHAVLFPPLLLLSSCVPALAFLANSPLFRHCFGGRGTPCEDISSFHFPPSLSLRSYLIFASANFLFIIVRGSTIARNDSDPSPLPSFSSLLSPLLSPLPFPLSPPPLLLIVSSNLF